MLRLAFVLVVLAACGGPSRVTYDQNHCYIDGVAAANLDEVEATQARISQRVLDRAPIYVAVTLAILLLAGASHIEKLFILFAARKQQSVGLAERLRAAMDRYRAHPVRYFGIVGATLLLLALAGGLYIYLDADKRDSERALAQLQFCHLALAGDAAQASLDEERKNFDALRGTVGDIKSLVDSLPPEEQRKAEKLLGQMRAALSNQDRLLARQNAVANAIQANSAGIQKELLALRQLPRRVEDVADGVKRLDGRVHESSQRLVGLQERLVALRCPPCSCNCRCEAPAPLIAAPRSDGGPHR